MEPLRIFLTQSARDFISVGAFLPSTRFLGKKILKGVKSKVILELGPGTGVFTREILKKLPPDGKLIAIENNKKFANFLRKEFDDPRLIICESDAREAKNCLAKNGINNVDCIISGLPLGNFKRGLKEALLKEAYNCLSDDGVFIQFEYLLAGYKDVKKYFPNIKIDYELFNIPPAFIMRCRK